MRILILNWRSIKDPLSGGAEIATFQHAKRWVAKHGADVVWLSPKYDLKIESEELEGVKFRYVGIPLKRNSQLHLLFSFPFFWFSVVFNYLFKLGEFNVVIDEVHGLPYFSPLFSRTKIILYIHEVAGVIWKQMYKFPLSFFGPLMERFIFIPYMNKTIVTGAESTVSELIKLGIPEDHINIVRNCLNIEPVKEPQPKEGIPTILFLNRVVKMKGIEIGIEAFAHFLEKNQKAKFWVAGKVDAEYLEFLKNKCVNLGIEDSVEFLGFITEEQKIDLFRRAHLYMNPSYKEGWGMGNIEANSQGTPAIAFKVPGNVDSIREGVSGYLCKPESAHDMADKMTKALSENYSELCKSSIEYSKLYNWDDNAEKFYNIINT